MGLLLDELNEHDKIVAVGGGGGSFDLPPKPILIVLFKDLTLTTSPDICNYLTYLFYLRPYLPL